VEEAVVEEEEEEEEEMEEAEVGARVERGRDGDTSGKTPRDAKDVIGLAVKDA
jgi:hypothetical protein